MLRRLPFTQPVQFNLPPCTTIAIHRSLLVKHLRVQGRSQDLEGWFPMAKCVCGQGVGVQSMLLFRGIWGHAAPGIFFCKMAYLRYRLLLVGFAT